MDFDPKPYVDQVVEKFGMTDKVVLVFESTTDRRAKGVPIVHGVVAARKEAGIELRSPLGSFHATIYVAWADEKAIELTLADNVRAAGRSASSFRGALISIPGTPPAARDLKIKQAPKGHDE